MTPPAKRKTTNPTATADDRPPRFPNESTSVTEGDIAQRAYELYMARGGGDGHDLDDWLAAERDLRGLAPKGFKRAI